MFLCRKVPEGFGAFFRALWAFFGVFWEMLMARRGVFVVKLW
jgi:hypothetical protein